MPGWSLKMFINCAYITIYIVLNVEDNASTGVRALGVVASIFAGHQLAVQLVTHATDHYHFSGSPRDKSHQ